MTHDPALPSPSLRFRRFFKTALAVLCLLSVALPAAAAVAQGAQEPPVEPAQPPAEDDLPPVPDPPRFIAEAVGTVGDIAGDLFFWGQTGTLTGNVLHNAVMGGQILNIDGRVEGDLFALAASTTIDGEIMGDVYAFTSDLRIAEATVIHGNLISFAGSVRVDGKIRGQMSGGGGITTINGDVGRIDIEAGSLKFGPNAVVHGDVDYQSNEDAELAEGAVVMGELRRQGRDEASDTDTGDAADEPASGFSFWSLFWKVWRYLANLVVGVVFLVLGGRGSRMPAALLRDRPGSGLGFGFVVAVVTPVACVVALVLLVTLPLGVIGLLLFGLLAYLGRLVAAQYFGDWLLRRLDSRGEPSPYLALALGLLVLLLVAMVPYVGFLVHLAAVLLGIGGIYLALRASGFPALGDDARAPQPETA